MRMSVRQGPWICGSCRRSILAAVLAALAIPVPGVAQDDEVDRGAAFINFAYAAQLGIGRYSVRELQVSTLKVPIGIPLRRGDAEKWGLALKVPITLGRYSVRALPGIDLLAEADAVSVIPGVELQIPVNRSWRLRPSVDLGYGRDLDSDLSAVFVSAGVLSRASWRRGKYLLTLGNGLTWAGHRPSDGGDSLAYTLIETGVDVRLPFAIDFLQRDNRFSLYFMNLHFDPRVELAKVGRRAQQAVDLWELGVTFGSDEPRKLAGFLSIRWIGIGYRFGEELRGVRLTAGFPF